MNMHAWCVTVSCVCLCVCVCTQALASTAVLASAINIGKPHDTHTHTHSHTHRETHTTINRNAAWVCVGLSCNVVLSYPLCPCMSLTGGGFTITQRMLDMFKRPTDPAQHNYLYGCVMCDTHTLTHTHTHVSLVMATRKHTKVVDRVCVCVCVVCVCLCVCVCLPMQYPCCSLTRWLRCCQYTGRVRGGPH